MGFLVGEEEQVSFEKRVENYLTYSGWWTEGELFGHPVWMHSKYLDGSPPERALWRQLEQDYRKEGTIDRAAEILERLDERD